MDLPVCECGCGTPVNWYKGKPRRFVSGHNAKGRVSPFSGCKHTREGRRKISAGLMGHKHSEETKRKLSETKMGEKNPNWGKAHSEETRRKITEALTGRPGTMTGRNHSDEAKRKISEAKMGEGNANWRGGKSFEPYGAGFNAALRRAIRERDEHTCQMCWALENGKAHACHHIDYDKTNNEPENLVALCAVCHSGTNSNRHYWTEFFQLYSLPRRM